MISNTKLYKVSDIADVQTGPFGSQLHKSDYVEEGTPIVTVEHLGNKKLSSNAVPLVNDDDKKRLKKYCLSAGDVVFSRVGSVDRCSIVSEKENGWLFSGRCLRVRADKDYVDPDFLYYVFCMENMKEYIKGIAVGATMPSINTKILSEVPIELPDLNEQKAIAATLSCLDDKIELNNRINKTLEEMAQAIFKSWFVDFEPFQDGEFEDSELGKIPKGWKVEKLDNIADYLNGLAMQKHRPEAEEYLPVIKIKELNQGFTDMNSDKASISIPIQYFIQDGDVIFSWSGTLMVKIWSGGLGGLNQHLFKVTSDKYDKWFYYLWTLNHLERFRAIAKDKATTMGHIKRSHLSESKVLIPNDSDMRTLNGVMNPIFKQMIGISVQNGNLKVIRDALLPKLMSGEVRAPIEEVQ